MTNNTKNTETISWLAIIVTPALVIFLLSLFSRDYSQRHYVWPTQMEYDAASEPFEVNRVLPEEMTMQLPVIGTIPRGYHPFHYDTTETSLLRAGMELRNPFLFDEQNLLRGKEVYENFCLVCHGKTGAGDGPLIPKYPNPTSYHADASKDRPDGEMFHIITIGMKNMPAHSSQADWNDRWKVILYIRQLQNK